MLISFELHKKFQSRIDIVRQCTDRNWVIQKADLESSILYIYIYVSHYSILDTQTNRNRNLYIFVGRFYVYKYFLLKFFFLITYYYISLLRTEAIRHTCIIVFESRNTQVTTRYWWLIDWHNSDITTSEFGTLTKNRLLPSDGRRSRTRRQQDWYIVV